MIQYSEINNLYYILPLIGFGVGLFGTMLGGGGGFLIIPVLTLLLGIPAHSAVLTSLVSTVPIGVAGTLGHHKKQNVDLKVAGMFALAGITGAFVGAYVTRFFSSEQLKTGFGLYSIFIAGHIARNTRRKENEQLNGQLNKKDKITRTSFFGVSAGLITGSFGTSGTAPIVAGLFSLRIPLKMVVGTSLLVVLANTAFAAGVHMFHATVDLTIVLLLTAGSLLGSILGPRYLSKIKTDRTEGKIKYVYAGITFLIGVLMIWG